MHRQLVPVAVLIVLCGSLWAPAAPAQADCPAAVFVDMAYNILIDAAREHHLAMSMVS